MPTNLLKNPTFQNFHDLPGIGAGQLAEDWSFDYDHGKRRPECRRGSVPPADDYEGAQQFFSTKALMDAWLFQRVYVGKENIGKRFVFGARLALKSENIGSGIGEYYASIGIDRWGETDPSRKTAQWLTPQHQMFVKRWTEFELRADVEGEWVTVYIQAANKYPVDGSLFVKSAYGYIVDADETTPTPSEPPPDVPDDLGPVIEKLDEAIAILGEMDAEVDAIAQTLSKPWSISK